MGLPKVVPVLSNLFEFYEAVSDWVDDGNAVDMVYRDFQKAFDEVPQRRLLAKVRACGVAGQVANWIANWLRGRKQRVAVSGKMSCWEDASHGVHRGSVVGPLLPTPTKVGAWGRAFSCVCLYVCMYVCMSVCLSVCTLTQTGLKISSPNLVQG